MAAAMIADLDARRRRAVYRAQHRGTREMDWLLGRFAEAHAAQMDETTLGTLERLLALTDPDLHAWILDPRGRDDEPLSSMIAAIRRFHGLDGGHG